MDGGEARDSALEDVEPVWMSKKGEQDPKHGAHPLLEMNGIDGVHHWVESE